MNYFKKLILMTFLLSGMSAALIGQTISGTITDEDGGPLLGAAVQVKGTSTGTTADADGKYSIQANQGDVLIFSYLGFATQQITVGSSSTIDVQMQEGNVFDEIIVSSTRKPIRKLQATTSINSVGAQELETIRPESFTEAIQNTPGVSIDNSQGRKGVFNIRGFPAGSFVSTLIDGIPASAVAGLSGGTQEFFGFDPNVARIEVVRGAAAALFGRSSAAGAINVISRIGGTEHKGSASITRYSNTSDSDHKFDGDFDFRADINFNGPISDKLRYNIGGYLINDSGQKEYTQKDKGLQIRGNLDWLITDKTSIRFYASVFDNQFQNLVDGVWDLENDRLPSGFSSNNTFYNDAAASGIDRVLNARRGFFNLAPALDESGTALTWNPADNKERTQGTSFGADGNFYLGNNWYINGKIRYNDFRYQDINELGSTTIFTLASTITRLNASALNQNLDLLGELRVTKEIDGENADHNITAGIFLSDAKRDRLGFNYFYGSDVSIRPTFIETGFSRGSFTDPTLPATVYISGTSSHREETATGLFIGDEMVFNDKLSVNVAFRYDWQRGLLDNDPEKLRKSGIDYGPTGSAFIENEIKLEDYSYSIGANYLIGETSAVYSNFNRSFTFQSVNSVTQEAFDNELVKNFEVGYRAGLGDLTVDVAYFNTNIENSISTVFDNNTGGFVDRPAGSYVINGGELNMTYAPKAVKGLLIRGGLTLQNSEYNDFVESLAGSTVTAINDNGNPLNLNLIVEGGNTALDLSGFQVRSQPKTIYNLNLGYNSKRWGANFGGFTYTGIYYDAANAYDKQSLSIYNLGGYVNFPLGNDELTLGLRVKNLFDGSKAQNIFTSGGLDEILQAKIADSSYTNQLAFAVIQNPRRMLINLAYKF